MRQPNRETNSSLPYTTTLTRTKKETTTSLHNIQSITQTKFANNTPTKHHKNQKIIKNKNKNEYSNNERIIIILPTPTKLTPKPDIQLTDHDHNSNTGSQNILNTPQRHWRNIGGNALQRLLNAPTNTTQWQPSTVLPVEAQPPTEFATLLHYPLLSSIYDYCQCPTIPTILRLKRKLDVHITTKDLRDIINHNIPIYHESLILCLEVICTAYDGAYMDPSFIPILKTQGWQGGVK